MFLKASSLRLQKGGGPSEKDFSDSLVMAWVKNIERPRPGEQPALGVQGSSLGLQADFNYKTCIKRYYSRSNGHS